jgi:hypothetical protein
MIISRFLIVETKAGNAVRVLARLSSTLDGSRSKP